MTGDVENSSWEALVSALREGRNCRLQRCVGASRGFGMAKLLADARTGSFLYVAPDDVSARALVREIRVFAPLVGIDADAIDAMVTVVPELEVSPYADVAANPRQIATRLGALGRIHDGETRLVVVGLRSLLRRVPGPEDLFALRHVWRKGDEVDRDELLQSLVRAGYLRVDVVEDPGNFAVRGGVVDLFAPAHRFPVRLEWSGDELERIRLFDPASQRSLREIGTVYVDPVRETVATGDTDLRASLLALADSLEVPSSRSRQVLENLLAGEIFFGIEALVPIFHAHFEPLWKHLPKGSRWIVESRPALEAQAERHREEMDRLYAQRVAERHLVCAPQQFFVDPQRLRDRFRDAALLLGEESDDIDAPALRRRDVIRLGYTSNVELRTSLAATRAERSGELLRPLLDRLGEVLRQNDDEFSQSILPEPWDVVIAVPNRAQRERLTHVLEGANFRVEDDADDASDAASLGRTGLVPSRLRIVEGELGEGFIAHDDRIWVLSESDIFGHATKKTRHRRASVGVASLSQLQVGDYVVHILHGIGRYHGLAKLEVAGNGAEFVLIEYAKSDRLYLPVHRIGEIERYSASEGQAPRLDKMGGTTFAAKTSKVKADARMLAEELLQLYAQREVLDGFAFPPPGADLEAFEATFPFEETPDQLSTLNDVFKDLTAERPMDRLVCGDVGFGKTEIALRAAFHVAMSGKQVAILAPTTILVQQHFHTFAERMESFPIEVRVLNRFQSAASKREVLEGLRDKSVDIVVGTHALLASDVQFRDLGLVIVDEEQRFGVRQKERFKKLKTKVDMLTLTATPIPRTLHMGLMGMREISMITTPPGDRLAVHTQLARHGDAVIEEGVKKELARGGQVFYVVPRIEGILAEARRISELVPDARVVVAHGKMSPEELERVMIEFVEHEHDVLVSTTIIESGLDIPRANTMFISRADQFGVSQLYQLRGRVGRARLRAECYLLVNSLEKLSDIARRRLEAIQRHAELGSGFQVAAQDLEIRGAGDLLGKRQSGSIAKVGFQAYSRALSEAVAEARGTPIVQDEDPEMNLDIPAFLPDDYIEDTGQRIELYRRLSVSSNPHDVREVLAEIHDRYGQLPIEATHYGKLMICRARARGLGIVAIEIRASRVQVVFGDRVNLSADAVVKLFKSANGAMKRVDERRMVCRLPERTGEDCARQLDAVDLFLARLEGCRVEN